jgi:hypothetical protein
MGNDLISYSKYNDFQLFKITKESSVDNYGKKHQHTLYSMSALGFFAMMFNITIISATIITLPRTKIIKVIHCYPKKN